MQEISEWLNRHRTAVVAIASAAVVIALLVVFWWIGGSAQGDIAAPRVAQAYFYDLNTGKLFTAPASQAGPIETDSGLFENEGAGVRAIVLSCGSCANENERFVGWLEKPDPDKEIEVSDNPSLVGNDEPTATLVRKPDGDAWYPLNSHEADRVVNAALQRCGDRQQIRFCHPPSRKDD